MDSEPEELQFLNFVGIIKESFTILRSLAKLFASLTLTLILPLCFMLLAHNLVTEPLVRKIRHDEHIVSEEPGTNAAARSERELLAEWIRLASFLIGYVVFVLAFSLLSTAAVVYSVACVYSEKALSYAKVLSVVPTVWKRLIITFCWVFLIMSAYHIAAILSLRLLFHIFRGSSVVIFFLFFACALAFFLGMQVYLSCIWHLASVISVLEESYGLGALKKSVYLIKGKRLLAFSLFSSYMFCTIVIGWFFHSRVVHGYHHHSAGNLSRGIYGFILISLLSCVHLVGMVVQTVFYFACKSCHHEKIDRMALSEHLGVYLGEYVPLKSSIQMEEMES